MTNKNNDIWYVYSECFPGEYLSKIEINRRDKILRVLDFEGEEMKTSDLWEIPVGFTYISQCISTGRVCFNILDLVNRRIIARFKKTERLKKILSDADTMSNISGVWMAEDHVYSENFSVKYKFMDNDKSFSVEATDYDGEKMEIYNLVKKGKLISFNSVMPSTQEKVDAEIEIIGESLAEVHFTFEFHEQITQNYCVPMKDD